MTALAAWFAERWLVRKAAPIWAFVKANPWRALAIAALLLAGWQHWQNRACEARAVAVKAAQGAAGAAQAAVNHEPARKAAAIARNSDDQAPAYYDGIRRAAAAHAVRMPRPASSVGPADLPGANPAQPGIHSSPVYPDEPRPELVCRPPVEDNWLVNAAARAAEMHQEALDLIAEGVAVAASDPTPSN